jgi:phosphohistidine swiveling domain-containing protein
MTDVLWLKLSDDTSLPEVLSPADRDRLRAIFDASNPASPWSRALSELGLQWPGGQVLEWFDDRAYVNGSAIATMISAGWVGAVRAKDGGFAYESRTKLMKLPSLLKSQWKIDAFVSKALDAPSATAATDEDDDASAVRQSLMLGLAMQALMLRLPKHEPRELAGWLAGSSPPPSRIAKTITDLKKIQVRRTELSAVWEKLFPRAPRTGPNPASDDAAAWLWVGTANVSAAIEPAPRPAQADLNGPWRGLPVHPGRRSGRAWLVDLRDPVPPPPSPYIAVFAQSRPETVQHYGEAVAIVFGEGGVLSHACSIARERGVPAVTAAGRSLIAALRGRPDSWLTVDGETGEVALAEHEETKPSGTPQ